MTVTSEMLLERVNALLPTIAARAEQTEAERRPNADTLAALEAAEVFQALVPKKYGGHELNLDTLAAIVRAVSSACMSTGWVTAFYIGHNWMLTKWPERVQQEVFAHRPYGLIPIQPSPDVTIKAVTGGYEVSGRSSFSSGIMNADWVIIMNAGGPLARGLVVPIADCQVDDVWHMSGMSGTGSNDVIVDKVFVPEHRALESIQLFTGTDSIHPNPLYSIPLLGFIYCEVMGVYCGGLDGATAAYDAHVEEKRMAWSGAALAERQATHISLGEAHGRARTAGILLDALVRDTMALAEARDFTVPNRLDLKLRAGYLSDHCREAVNALIARSGTRNFAVNKPIQRFFRDINMLSTHAFIDWEVSRELYGRHLLGLQPNSPLY